MVAPRTHHVGHRGAGSDGVDADALRAVGRGGRLGEAVERPLHRAVAGQFGVAPEAADGRVVDEGARARGGPDGGDLGGHGQPRAPEVHGVDVVEVVLPHLVQRARRHGGPAVVEGDVEPSVQVDGAVDGGADTGPVGQVAHRVVRGAAGRPDLLGHRLQLVFRAGREQDPGALPGEQPRRGGTDAAAGTGDEGDLAGQQAGGGGGGCAGVR